MASHWDNALDQLYSGSFHQNELALPVPFSSFRAEVRESLARLRQVDAFACEMAKLPENQNVLISELHERLYAQFPDVPTRICSKILKYTLDPRC